MGRLRGRHANATTWYYNHNHNQLFLYLLAILVCLQVSCAFQYVSGSSCQSVCENGSLDADAVCLDTEFNSTTGGIRLKSCVSCLLSSTAVDSTNNETDVEFALLAMRFTLSSCMFGVPDERVSLSSPCQVTCTPLNNSINYNLTKTPAASDAELNFCTASQFDDTTINNCAFCYSLIPQQLFVANFLQALHIACRDPPVAGNAFYPDAASIFNDSLIVGPTATAAATTRHGLHGGLLAAAIVAPVVGGSLLISAICCGCFVFTRRRRRRMAESGRINRIHEHEAALWHDAWVGGDKQPAHEMNELTPSSATATVPHARWSPRFPYQEHQKHPEPGLALGGHEFDKKSPIGNSYNNTNKSPLRNSYHQRDDVGPGQGQIQDPNLHEQYFGLDKEVGNDRIDQQDEQVAAEAETEEERRYALRHQAALGGGVGGGDDAHYFASPSSSNATTAVTTAPAAATAAANHGQGLYDQIRAEHTANPNLQYRAYQQQQQLQQHQQQQQQYL